MSLIVEIELWRRDIETSSPNKYLFFTVLGSGLRFVESLKRSVMPLIESPMLVVGDPN